MEKQIHPLIAKYAGSIDSKLTLKKRTIKVRI